MHNSFSKTNRRGSHSRIRLGPAVFILAAAVAVIVTLGGARELLSQIIAAPGGKSGLITIVIGFGLVLLGPVLLAALAMLTPRSWIPGIFDRIGLFFSNSRPKSDHSPFSQ